jgi:hypothetical protein
MQGERGRWVYAGAPVGAPSFCSGLTLTGASRLRVRVHMTPKKDSILLLKHLVKMAEGSEG